MDANNNIPIPTGYYLCGNCNQIVPYAGTHYCQPAIYSYMPGYTLFSPDAETKELLKRIADALEKIANK